MNDALAGILITLAAYNFLLMLVGLMMWTTVEVSRMVEGAGVGLFTVGGGALLILGLIWIGTWLGTL